MSVGRHSVPTMTQHTEIGTRRPTSREWIRPAAVGALVGAVAAAAVLVPYYLGVVAEWESSSSELRTERDEALEANVVLEENILRQGQRADDAESRLAGVEAREAAVAEAEAAVASREAAVTVTEETIEASSITTGVWTVGRDVAPGTYVTESEVSADCYWAIYVSGTNQDDIIQNDIVTGGRPTITIAEGQDFESNRCGTWVPAQ